MLNTSAVVAFWLGIESGSRRDQAGTLVIGSFAEGRCGFRRCSRQRLDYAVFGLIFIHADDTGFYEPKALYIGN